MTVKEMIQAVVHGEEPSKVLDEVTSLDPKDLLASMKRDLAKVAKEYGGKKTHGAQVTTVVPGSHQRDLPTWVFSNEGDAEEFETYAVDYLNRFAYRFK